MLDLIIKNGACFIEGKLKNLSLGVSNGKIVEIDNVIRDGLEDRGLKNKLYLHRSCAPLKDVEFADQQELFMCEEGFCGL